MITADDTPRKKQNDRFEFGFKGLSTDAKPISKYHNMLIANGSSYLAIDTKEVFFYDEEDEQWV